MPMRQNDYYVTISLFTLSSFLLACFLAGRLAAFIFR
jgi:hypothetical protein